MRLQIKEFYSALKKEILDCYSSSEVDDETAMNIMYYREGESYNERD